MTGILRWAQNRKCIKCDQWKMIDEFSVYNKRVKPIRRRRLCKSCQNHASYRYRAKLNPNYQRRETVVVTESLRAAVKVLVRHYGRIDITCQQTGLSKSAYHRIMRLPAYTPSGKRNKIDRRIAEMVVARASEIVSAKVVC